MKRTNDSEPLNGSSMHNVQNAGWSAVRNEFIRNKEISGKAKHVLILLLSNTGDWQFNAKWTAENQMKEGIDYLYSALDELKKLGYVHYERRQGSRGRFEHHYYYSDEPKEQWKTAVRPDREFPCVENTCIKEDQLKNTSNLKNDEEDGEKDQGNQFLTPSIPSPKSSSTCKYGIDLQEWFDKCSEAGLKPVWTNREKTGFKSLCPVHLEDSPSFVVSKGKIRAVVCHCHGCGCGIEDASQYLWGASTKNQRSAEQHYIYTDENEVPQYKICRTRDKSRMWIEVPKDGRWVRSKLEDRQRRLYRLHRLVKAPIEETIYIVEGEKDVESAEVKGLTATCNPFGAKGWRSYFTDCLKGRRVVIIADKDDAGRKWAELVQASLSGIARSVVIMETPVDKTGADLTDHFSAGMTTRELVAA